MRNLSFQVNKISRAIRTQGSSFTFVRPEENEFGEPIGNASLEIVITGLYHTTGGFVTANGADGSTTRSKRSPMVLTLIEDSKKLQSGDKLEYRGKTYTITEVQDVAELGICAEISLEEQQGNGKSNVNKV